MLRRRNKTFTARTFVPVALQPLIRRSEIVKSMGTSDRADAVLLASEWNHRGDSAFRFSRMNMSPDKHVENTMAAVAKWRADQPHGT